MPNPKFRMEVHQEALRELRMDPGVGGFVMGVAERIADAAGPGFEAVESKSSRTRYRARVETVTTQARVDVARDPSILIRAMDAGRG